MADDVLKALQDEAAYFKVNKDGKLECILNNHAFPPQLDVVKAFIRYEDLEII
jgi:hypothetical protein